MNIYGVIDPTTGTAEFYETFDAAFEAAEAIVKDDETEEGAEVKIFRQDENGDVDDWKRTLVKNDTKDGYSEYGTRGELLWA